MHEVYREFLANFMLWTIVAGLCLGTLFTAYRAVVFGVKTLIRKHRKAKRLKEFKSHFTPRIV